MERIRKVDVESMTEEQLKNAQEALSNKISDIVNRAIAEANKYANVYGLEAMMSLNLVKQGEANLIKERLKQQQE